jgi:hypothetical protein
MITLKNLILTMPFGHWETMTFVSALRHDGMVAPMLIQGPMNGELFLAYVEQCLAPTFKPKRSHSARSRASDTPFALSSPPSRGKNASTISNMPAMLPYDREPL